MISKIDYLLTILAEECTEVGQRATKAIRFTLDEKEPDQDLTNKERLIQEFNDLYGVMCVLQQEKVFDDFLDLEAIEKKMLKIEKFYKYSMAVKSGEVANYADYKRKLNDDLR